MRRRSLRRHVVGLALLGMVLVWGAMLAVNYHEAQEEVTELADLRLQDTALSLMLLDLRALEAMTQLPRIVIDDNDGDDDQAKLIGFQVWDGSERLLFKTTNAPDGAFSRQSGLMPVSAGGEEWQTYAIWDPEQTFQIRLFEKQEVRDHLAAHVTLNTSLGLIIGMVAMGILLWLAVTRGLASLGPLTADVERRNHDRLDPIDVQHAPTEVQPLVESFNRLMHRLQISLEKERNFTADAAHELRTPLAAIKVQAEALRRAQDPQAQKAGIARIIQCVDDTTRSVQQLLSLARIEHELGDSELQPTDLGKVARDCLSRAADKAVEKQIEIELDAKTNCIVFGDATMLESLIGNLVENAVNYTQPGGRVVVAVERVGTFPAVVVSDNGPGVPPDERTRILDRFYRVAGSGVAGSGLGLSIVQAIAKLHNATIELGDGLDGEGLAVSVRFPAVEEAPSLDDKAATNLAAARSRPVIEKAGPVLARYDEIPSAAAYGASSAIER